MKKIVPAAQMRELDRLTSEQYATPSLLLMEAAAEASLKALKTRLSDQGLSGRRVLVLCGRGNNGGDGAALARQLWLAGAQPEVVLFGRVEETRGDARINFEIVRRLAHSPGITPPGRPPALSFTECDSVDAWERIAGTRRSDACVVDAIFGTGLTRPLEGIYLRAVEYLASLREGRESAGSVRPLIVSLDLPSGLSADLAMPIGAAVHADLTITFTAPKPANVLPPAAHFGGHLVIAAIGSPPELIDRASSRLFLTENCDARRWLEQTRYTPDSYKNTHGHALIVAGSRRMTGAAVLCAEAALRAGAGLATVATPRSAAAAVAARIMPEVMTDSLPETGAGTVSLEALDHVVKLIERVTAVAVGPGLSSAEEETRAFVRAMVERRASPLVIDADGLNALAPWPEELRGSGELPLILTPHEGEMRRLIGAADREVMRDRVRVVSEFAAAHSLIVVLKGTRTLIAAPDGCVFVNPTGNAGLGTAGSGDTLTGIITGFIAQAYATLNDRADALTATIAAVYIGGLAGDLAAGEIGMRTLVASDIHRHLSAAVRAVDRDGEEP